MSGGGHNDAYHNRDGERAWQGFQPNSKRGITWSAALDCTVLQAVGILTQFGVPRAPECTRIPVG